jgi:hypothetical protein
MTDQVVLFPFARVALSDVSLPAWFVDGVPIEDADLSTIDGTTVLNVECRLSVDLGAVRTTLGPGTFDLQLLLSSRSDDTGLQFPMGKLPLASSREHRLKGSVAVDLLGDAATLRVDLLCSSCSPSPSNKLAPAHAGALLWSATQPLRLFGIGSRFPMRAIPFTDLPRFANGCWHLELDEADATASVMSAVRLDLNAARPEIVAILQGGPSLTPESHFVRDQLKVDIARRFTTFATELLTQDSAEIRREYPFDSIGALALRFAERLRVKGNFTSIEELAELIRENPASFETLLQAVFVTRGSI